MGLHPNQREGFLREAPIRGRAIEYSAASAPVDPRRQLSVTMGMAKRPGDVTGVSMLVPGLGMRRGNSIHLCRSALAEEIGKHR
jgi:hypothetical protein